MLDNLIDLDVSDISPHWKGSTARERQIIQRISKLDGTPRAAQHLAKHAAELSDYWYWYTLSTCWVCYSGFNPIAFWRRLFNAPRPHRSACLMKPSEVTTLDRMPSEMVGFRAHRPDEQDWIAYTLDPATAGRFARERGTNTIAAYGIRKADVVALFARRREAELIILDPGRASFRGDFTVQA